MIEALYYLKEEGFDLKCKMYGKGVDNDNSELLQKINKADLKEMIELCGQTDNIEEEVAKLDAVCSPSYSEALPNVLLEAMACECVCVATNVGDNKEILEDTGVIINNQDGKTIAQGIKELYDIYESTKWEEEKKKCRKIIERKFSNRTMVEKYNSLWSSK